MRLRVHANVCVLGLLYSGFWIGAHFLSISHSIFYHRLNFDFEYYRRHYFEVANCKSVKYSNFKQKPKMKITRCAIQTINA